jgi:hypothetical protein
MKLSSFVAIEVSSIVMSS